MAARRRVLIVEPDPDVCEAVKAPLEEVGYEVEIASDGRVALAAIERARPDVLVLELLIPGLDGVLLLRMLRARAESRKLPVIVATARDDAATMIDVGAMDIRTFLTKPYTSASLIAQVSRVLG